MSKTKLWSVRDKHDSYMEVTWIDTGVWEVVINDSVNGASVILDTDNLWHLVRALESELKVSSKHGSGEKVDNIEETSGMILKAAMAEVNKTLTNDSVNHPSHYTAYKGVEVIDLTEQMNFNRGNAVKYICRAGLKAAETELEDLRKARWYLDREIDRILKGQEL